MKILIVDDEALARDRLRRLLAELPEAEVVGEAATGREALDQVQALEPDLVLLDIRMPEMDGLEAARHLATLPAPPAVIFTTAYGEHALEAFEACALGYLLKPVRADRLATALANARRLTRAQAGQLEGEAPRTRTHILVRERGNLRLIPVADIRYFRADHKYVAVGTTAGETLIEESLKSLEEEFGERFVRVHRNALVARGCLQALEKNAEGQLCVPVAGTEVRLEVSRRHAGEIRQLLRERSEG